MADEHRDRDVEQRDHEAGREQRDEQALRLTRVMPIERHEPRGGLRVLWIDRRLQQPFEQREHLSRPAKGPRPRLVAPSQGATRSTTPHVWTATF
jgi:hypothetical protein